MSNNRLGIEIGADNSQLKKAAKETIGALEQVEKAAKKTAGGLGAAGGKGGKGFDKLGKSAGNALPALTDVSRVIQDAPFGIIGVGNNITQLASSFTYLKRDTGSSGAAFKALGKSLAGPGGLVFGISAVVSLLTVLGPELFKVKTETTELANAQAEGVGQSAASATELQSLLSIARDSTKSTQARKNAIEELNSKYGSYLGNLDLEKVNSEKTTTAVNALTEGLKAQALARGALELITKKSKELFEIQNDLSKSAGFTAISLGTLKGFLDPLSVGTNIATEAQKQQVESIDKLQKELTNLTTSYQGLLGNALNTMPAKIDKTTKAIKKQIGAIGGSTKSFDGDLSDVFRVDSDKITEKLSGQVFSSIEKTSAKLRNNVVILEEGLSPMEKALIDFNDRAENIIGGAISDTFGNIGTVIGDALAGGGNVVEGIGASILGGVAGLLDQLGDLAIQAGVGMALVKAAFQSLNPALAIGAGVALKAVAAVFSSGAASIGGQIKGSSGSPGGIGAGGGTSSLVSSPSVRQGEGQTVVFEIAGTKLVGVLNRTLAKNGRTLSDSL